MTTRCAPRLQPGPPSQTPGGSGPEVLKRERGHVTIETWSFCGGGLQGPPAQCLIKAAISTFYIFIWYSCEYTELQSA